MLHEAIRSNHYQLCHVNDLVEIKSHNKDQSIICVPFDRGPSSFQDLMKNGFYNYVTLKEDHKEINQVLFNFLIKLQQQSFILKAAEYNKENLFECKSIQNILQQKNTPSELQKRISIVMNELLSNAIIHGKTSAAKLEYTIYLDYIILSVTDEKGSLTRKSLNKIYDNSLKEVNPNELRTAGIGLDTVKMYSEGIAIIVKPEKETRIISFINLKKSLNYCGFIFYKEELKDLNV